MNVKKEIQIEMNKALDSFLINFKPKLDEIEASVLQSMRKFGASEYDIEETKKWLRLQMNYEMLKMIVDKISLAKVD